MSMTFDKRCKSSEERDAVHGSLQIFLEEVEFKSKHEHWLDTEGKGQSMVVETLVWPYQGRICQCPSKIAKETPKYPCAHW